MEPVPYEIREDDIDEVLDAYEPTGGGAWPEDARAEVRRHVMRNINELDDTVRSAAEDPADDAGTLATRTGPERDRPGDRAPDRRDMALAAIEDLLIRDGYLELDADESRTFPVTGDEDSERNDL